MDYCDNLNFGNMLKIKQGIILLYQLDIINKTLPTV